MFRAMFDITTFCENPSWPLGQCTFYHLQEEALNYASLKLTYVVDHNGTKWMPPPLHYSHVWTFKKISGIQNPNPNQEWRHGRTLTLTSHSYLKIIYTKWRCCILIVLIYYSIVEQRKWVKYWSKIKEVEDLVASIETRMSMAITNRVHISLYLCLKKKEQGMVLPFFMDFPKLNFLK